MGCDDKSLNRQASLGRRDRDGDPRSTAAPQPRGYDPRRQLSAARKASLGTDQDRRLSPSNRWHDQRCEPGPRLAQGETHRNPPALLRPDRGVRSAMRGAILWTSETTRSVSATANPGNATQGVSSGCRLTTSKSNRATLLVSFTTPIDREEAGDFIDGSQQAPKRGRSKIP